MIYRLFIVLSLLSGSCFGGPINIWVDDTSGNIGKVDIATGVVSSVGAAGVPLTDIAFSPNGTLYGVSFNELYTISSSTGAATAVGPLGISDANALVFSSTGTLYTATVSGSLYTVNTSSGAATDVGPLGGGYGSGGDLAFIGGKLYLATSSDRLVIVDPTTGAASLVGPFGVANVFGLATPDNVNLYAVAGQNLYTVNLATGAATLDVSFAGNPHGLGIASGESFFSEATSAAPEPGNLALFGVGGGLLSLSMSRTRRARP